MCVYVCMSLCVHVCVFMDKGGRVFWTVEEDNMRAYVSGKQYKYVDSKWQELAVEDQFVLSKTEGQVGKQAQRCKISISFVVWFVSFQLRDGG